MTEDLNTIALKIAAARAQKREAEKIIEDLTPKYNKLLDQMIGRGQVEFNYNGWKYGRVVAQKSVFDLDRFRAECPKIAAQCVRVEEKHVLDEDALTEYLSLHPEAQKVVSDYVDTKPEERWKKPVQVKE